MQTRTHPSARFRPSLPFLSLILFLTVLWLAGGSSRPEVAGQAVVRLASVVAIIVAVLFCRRPSFSDTKPVLIILSAATLLALLQLIPLPPAWWQSLPGRDLFVEAARITGEAQPWRPWSIVPSLTLNALFSLIVPAAVLLLLTTLNRKERGYLPATMLILVGASMLVGLLQFSGVRTNNPLIDDVGQVSGTFSNRNHFALLLTCGCLLVPAWVFLERPRVTWRAPVAIGLLLLFLLMTLASGSRAGLLLAALSIPIAFLLVGRNMRKAFGRAPHWVLPAVTIAIMVVAGLFVAISIFVDRAESVDRALLLSAGDDLRVRALPTLFEMVKAYFPVGSGLGGFDPVFRIHEPLDLLKRSYFNRAHDDFLEIAIEAGLPGIALLAGSLIWWAVASFRVWRAGSGSEFLLARAGSAMLLFIFIASVFDYPARMPLIMAIIVIAAFWLSTGAAARRAPARERSVGGARHGQHGQEGPPSREEG